MALRPTTEAELAACVADAAAARTPLAVVGGGTRRGFGRPAQTARDLSTAGLAGITLYEPAEMVIAARAGTPLAAVEAALAARGQRLPFEPPDWRGLYGSAGEPTIGAVAAGNLSGPRRISAGAARDALIGVRFVNGRGEVVKSGGRVMKNVTGLDLVKLIAGSWGTLGVLTEVTFKVLPIPETSETLVLEDLPDERAVAALSAGLGSPFEVTGAAHLPAAVGGRARTLLRLEGFAPSVAHRAGALTRLLAHFGKAERLGHEAGAPEWVAIRDAAPLAAPREAALWRVSVAPSKGPGLVAAVARVLPIRHFYDWGGGLVWIVCEAKGDAGAAAIRTALAASGAGGHATLARAPLEVRAAADVFQPLPEALMRLTRGIKAQFDPAGILEAGRMYAGV